MPRKKTPAPQVPEVDLSAVPEREVSTEYIEALEAKEKNEKEQVKVISKMPYENVFLVPKRSRLIEDEYGNYERVYSKENKLRFKKGYAYIDKEYVDLLKNKHYYGIDYMLADELKSLIDSKDKMEKNKGEAFLKDLVRRWRQAKVETGGLINRSISI